MKIAAITKFKNGAIFMLLKKLGWSQADLARRSGVHASWISAYCNMRQRPTEQVAQKIQNAFGEAGEFLDVLEAWPPEFKPLKRSLVIEQVKDVELDALDYECHLNYLQEFNLEREEMDKTFRELLPVLSDRELSVIEGRYGLSGGDPKTCETIGKQFNVTRSEINRIERKALRKLRRQYEFEICDHEASLEIARIKHYGQSRPRIEVVEPARPKHEPTPSPKVSRKKRRRRKFTESNTSWNEINTVPKTPQEWVSMCDTPFGFYIPNLIKTVKRPTSLGLQIEKGMIRAGFCRSSAGTFVKHSDGDTVIRTVYNKRDTSVYYILVSRFPKLKY